MFEGLQLARLYHAYVLTGDREAIVAAIEEFLAREGVAVKGNPDYRLHTHDQFLIEDSHALIRAASMRGVAGRKFFVHAFSFITHEAQNALLKMLEEPPRGTHFFIIVPHLSVLLPTVRSRMIALSWPEAPKESANYLDATAAAFVQGSVAERLEMVKKIAEDKASAAAFFGALERYYAAGDQKSAADLEALYRARVFIRDRGSSPKMLLEYVALTLASVHTNATA